MHQPLTAAAAAAILPLLAAPSAAQAPPADARQADAVDRARARALDDPIPKAPQEAVGTPPILTPEGSSVPGTPAPSQAAGTPPSAPRPLPAETRRP